MEQPVDDSKPPAKASKRKVKRLAPEREIETIPEQLGSQEDETPQPDEEAVEEGKGKKRKGKARKDSKGEGRMQGDTRGDLRF